MVMMKDFNEEMEKTMVAWEVPQAGGMTGRPVEEEEGDGWAWCSVLSVMRRSCLGDARGTRATTMPAPANMFAHALHFSPFNGGMCLLFLLLTLPSLACSTAALPTLTCLPIHTTAAAYTTA